MKIALYGGTFNPIHLGHLHAAHETLTHLALDKIIFIPSARPPHKQDQTIIDFVHRHTMVKLAIHGRPCFTTSDFEQQQQGQSYTINTVEHFHKVYPEAQLYLIMGNDMSASFSTWKNWQQLLTRIQPIVLVRPNSQVIADPALPQTAQAQLNEAVLHVETLNCSSTGIRKSFATNQNTQEWLTPEVHQYIESLHLYVQKNVR